MFYTLTLFNKASDTVSHSVLVTTPVRHGLAFKVGGKSARTASLKELWSLPSPSEGQWLAATRDPYQNHHCSMPLLKPEGWDRVHSQWICEWCQMWEVISVLEDMGTWADWRNGLIEMSWSSVKVNEVLDLEWDNPMPEYKVGTD